MKKNAEHLFHAFIDEILGADLNPDEHLWLIASLLHMELLYADEELLPRFGFGSTEVWNAFIKILEGLDTPRFRVVK